MRVCPKCGHRDSPCWRNAWYKRFTDVTRQDDIALYEPELFKKLQESPNFYSDGLYNYKISKHGYVIRILQEHAVNPNSCEEPHREIWRLKLDSDINQCRLFEKAKK